MAKQSIESIFALHNHQLVVAEGEFRISDWEVIEGEDLYADVESLQSFSISSGDEDDGMEPKSEGVPVDQDYIHSPRDDYEVAVREFLQVIEGEDLYADVESLQSFSISFGDEDDGMEPKSEGVPVNQDDIHSPRDDCEVAVREFGPHLEESRSEHHSRQLIHGFDFDDGTFYSGDCDDDSVVDSDADDVVGEPTNRDFVPLVGPLGFHVCNSANPVFDLGSSLNLETCGDVEVDGGIVSEPHAPTRCNLAMFIRPGESGDERDVVDDSGIDASGGDDDDGGYEIDVDDELVPWGVANRLERQRMKKLGKRTFAKMNKSKKMAHFYTKPACFHAKHGLGLRAH